MPVSSTHYKYNANAKRWALVRAIIANDACGYIRTVDKNDSERSKQYKEDAILTNFTKLTRDGLAGLVLRKPAKIKLPKQIQYIQEDATGENISLEQLSNQVIHEVLETGRCGLFVDYPKATPDLSGLDREEQGYYSRIKFYSAESIINHAHKTVGSKYVLSEVRLKEEVQVRSEDGWDWICLTQYRVLYLDFANRYAYSVYNEKEELIENGYPVDGNGREWNEIPFQFVGSKCNDADFDEIPLYDSAVLNLGHYRNSADLEESSFITGQPYLVVDVGETSQEQFDSANPNGVAYGSRKGLILGRGGRAELLQASPNQLADQLMKRKEEQAASIGVRFIAPPGAGRETAEGVRNRFASSNSVLHIITTNISLAITQCLKWVCAYQKTPSKSIKFELNTQFYEESADPNLIVQQMLMHDKKLMPAIEVIKYGQKTGFIDDDRDPQEILDEAKKNIVAEATPAPTKLEVTNSDLKNKSDVANT